MKDFLSRAIRGNLRGKIEADAAFKEAQEFSRKYEPKEGIDYDWVRAHATEEFRCGEARITAIEAKADSLIKYLGAGSGIVALLLATAPKWQVVPTLIFILLALLMAVTALQPGEHPMLPRTKTALEFADTFTGGKKAVASFAAKTAVAATGMAIAAEHKATRVRWAFWLFFFGMVWLVGYSAIHRY
jgi:hypothetical protein